MKYQALNWDEGWAELVDPIVEAHENDKPYDRLENKYERRYVESASCQLYAERLFENLQAKNEKYEFAAHTDATAWPPNSWWRIVVRKPNGRPLSETDLSKLQRSAKAILRNIEKKYPGVGEQAQQKATKTAERKLKKDYAAMGLDVTLPGEQRRGCLLRLLWPFG